MNAEQFSSALGKVNDKYIMEAITYERKKKSGWLKWGAMAACFGLIVTVAMAALPGILRGPNEIETPPNFDPGPLGSGNEHQTNNNLYVPGATSDTYFSLEELLDYLSEHDNHSPKIDGSRSVSAITSQTSVKFKEFTYQIENNAVRIYQNGTYAGCLDTKANYLYLGGNRLVVIGELIDDDLSLEAEESVSVKIYDIAATPSKPACLAQFTQLGSLSACYLVDSRLYLMTSDGVCACGWSRLDDVEKYIPQLKYNDEVIDWRNEEIHILGSPASVEYIAVTQISVNQLEIEHKNAYYGNITNVFYGDNWYAFTTASTSEDIYVLPDFYTFDASALTFTGKVDLASVFNLEKAKALEDGHWSTGEYPSIRTASVVGTVWQAIGEYRIRTDSSMTTKLFALTFDIESGKVTTETIDLSSENFSIDDVLWEGNQAIISIGLTDANSDTAQIVFAIFDGANILFHQNNIVCDRVRGIDEMYMLGNPMHIIHPFISLGDGIYLRYNGVPNGFDIYDFTNRADPKCLYQSNGEVPAECRLDFDNVVYDENTIGVKIITPDNGNYHNVTYSWGVFSVNPFAEKPFELSGEYQLVQGKYLPDKGSVPAEYPDTTIVSGFDLDKPNEPTVP